MTPPTVAFNVLVNLLVCTFFTLFAFYCARPPTLLHRLSPRLFRQVSKAETIAICFCAPGKTQALGIPLIAAMYSSADDQTRALIQVPMILYTAEQILVGQVLVWWFKRWIAKDTRKDEETIASAPEPEPVPEVDVEEDKQLYK
jgi:sodium/bile acid cotransporter 7